MNDEIETILIPFSPQKRWIHMVVEGNEEVNPSVSSEATEKNTRSESEDQPKKQTNDGSQPRSS
jgi:hypothetical protein